MPTRTATARWDGPFEGGSRTMLLGGGTFDGTYSDGSRFEDEGTSKALAGVAEITVDARLAT
jgi:hypothetical protein